MSSTLRQPSDRNALYLWHGRALAALVDNRAADLRELAANDPDALPPIQEDAPQCGYFKLRKVRAAAFVPAKIYLEQVIGEDGELLSDEILRCEIGDELVDPLQAWPMLCLRPISASEYRYLMAVRAWAQTSAPDQPQAQEGRRIDWLSVKIPPVPPAAPKRKK